mgnify:CR=1 FL=1
MFSRFYRPPALGLPFCARLGKRKYQIGRAPQRSEDDFLLTNQAPKGGRLAAKTRRSKTFAA